MRLQLALNVTDLDDAIGFYTKLFDAEPAKVKPGYANWEVADPPLKLVVFERPDAEPGSINHLGVETEDTAQLIAAERRLRGAGLATSGVDETVCCFAEKVETWVTGPDGSRWEWYVKQADHDTQLESVARSSSAGTGAPDCC